ncbi:MAG: methylated-DNA--[protein]-cysteine S-methyltransferase [Gammaproteobacteria bacterium]|jgi:AraC family transcriptional regulator of adaptative response/methylated-DNA-[protein]-cysteine methyltransferase
MHKQYYQATIETPMGPMVAVADEYYLYRLDFADKYKIQNTIAKKVAPLESIEQELASYFSGLLKQFTTPLKPQGTDFQQQVWRALQTIPFGETWSYLQLAQAVNKPTAYRAVANANGKNPLSIIIPCHRVINHNGQLGGYAGGLNRKIALLKHEGIED